jgi:ribosomal-protein-alanine N-acetyltransferase
MGSCFEKFVLQVLFFFAILCACLLVMRLAGNGRYVFIFQDTFGATIRICFLGVGLLCARGNFIMDLVCGNEGRVYVRWMVRRDFPEVMAIENSCFEFPWREEDFQVCLKQRNCIGMVAEVDGRVVGFMIYETPKNRIHLLNIATLPEFQRRGVATQMVQKLIGKLTNHGRTRISMEIRESNLPALIFFRSRGFRATGVLHCFYEDTNDDAYVMQYRTDNPQQQQQYAAADQLATKFAS